MAKCDVKLIFWLSIPLVILRQIIILIYWLLLFEQCFTYMCFVLHHNYFIVCVCRSTFMYEQFPEVMNMLWTRMLKDNKKNWRRVYKVWRHSGQTSLKLSLGAFLFLQSDTHVDSSVYTRNRLKTVFIFYMHFQQYLQISLNL